MGGGSRRPHDRLRLPYGLTVYESDNGTYILYVTDAFSEPDGSVPPPSALDGHVKQFRFTVEDGTLRHQHVRIVGLNSEAARSDEDVRAAQTEWLRSMLKDARRDDEIRWVVATFHHPMFLSGEGRTNEALRTEWRPIFDEYNVDLVMQGHDHTYARGVPRRRVDWGRPGPLVKHRPETGKAPRDWDNRESGPGCPNSVAVRGGSLTSKPTPKTKATSREGRSGLLLNFP